MCEGKGGLDACFLVPLEDSAASSTFLCRFVSLPDLVTSGNSHIRSVTEGRGRAGKPDGNTSNLCRSSNSAQRVRGRPLGEQMWVLVEVDTGHTRSDVAWRDAVDSNVVRAPLGSQVSCHLQHGGLGGVVGDPVVVSVDDGSGHRRDENDRAVDVGLLVHLSGSGTSGQENTGGVDVKDLLEGLDGVVEGIVGLQARTEAKNEMSGYLASRHY